MREIQDVVGKLGEMSTDDIVAHLREHGIRGKVGNSTWCPLANYIMQETEMSCVSVGDIVAWGQRCDGTFGKIMTPRSMLRFINRFDTHAYPDLEE